MTTPNKGGKIASSGLFKELCKKGWEKYVKYSLEDWKETFLESNDSSGYLCAGKVLEHIPKRKRWGEWKRIFSNPRMSVILEAWKEELEICVRANAEQVIISGGDKEAITRARYVLDGHVFGKGKVGRPSKEQVTKKERIAKGVKDFHSKNPEAQDDVIKLAD